MQTLADEPIESMQWPLEFAILNIILYYNRVLKWNGLHSQEGQLWSCDGKGRGRDKKKRDREEERCAFKNFNIVIFLLVCGVLNLMKYVCLFWTKMAFCPNILYTFKIPGDKVMWMCWYQVYSLFCGGLGWGGISVNKLIFWTLYSSRRVDPEVRTNSNIENKMHSASVWFLASR